MLQRSFEDKRVIWAFFSLLLSYLLLRAWFVDPIHDETATFFHFIEYGDIWSNTALKDANNHLLNSWLGRFIYLLCGDSFFALRLPAIAAFALYFWSSYGLVRRIYFGAYSIYVFVALNTLPWLADYFAYTRGYGLAIGFFMGTLYFLSCWIQSKQWKHMAWMSLFIYLAVLSNLTYLITSLLLCAFVFFFLLIYWKKFEGKNRIIPLLIGLVFILGLLPLIYHTFELKNAGALYYGSLDGLWWVTGKSLSKCVFFTENDNLRFVYGLFALVCAAVFIWQWRNMGFKKLLLEESTWFTALLIGNIVAILFLAKVLKVNYPEDRAAMYMVPLAMLAFSSLIKYVKGLRIVLLLYVGFPILFILKLNLNTSVFSPDDRMTEAFYLKATKDLKPDQTISICPIMQLNYAHWERKHHIIKHPANLHRYFDVNADFIMTKSVLLGDSVNWKKTHYLIAEDKASTYVALRKKQHTKGQLILDTLVEIPTQSGEYINFIQMPIKDSWKNKALVIDVQSSIKTDSPIDTYNFVVASNDANGQNLRYEYMNMRWYEGKNIKHFKLHFPFAINQFKAEESQLIIYIWNREKHQTQLKNTRIRIKAKN